MTTRYGLILALGLGIASTLPAQAPLDSLIAADAAASDSGYSAAIAHAADNLMLVYPGAPVIMGRAESMRMLEMQTALRGLSVHWVPLHGEVAADGSFGVTWGVTVMVDASSPGAVRFGKYLSAWRREGGAWKLAANAQAGMVASSAFVMPPNLQVGQPVIEAPGAPFALADSAFASQAGRQGAAAAFAAFIAPDGAMFSGSGEVVHGPAGARRLLGANRSRWRWHPVAVLGSGDLGATVGEAEIDAPDGTPFYSKYLTLWRRQPNGDLRFIADGGNARPVVNDGLGKTRP